MRTHSARDNDALSIRRILEESPTDPSYVLRSRTTAETPLHVCSPDPHDSVCISHQCPVGAACCKSWKRRLHSTASCFAQTPSRGMLHLTCFVWMLNVTSF